MKQEFFDTAMRKKIYSNLDDLQEDLDYWLHHYNHERPHSGKYCYGKTPIVITSYSIHYTKLYELGVATSTDMIGSKITGEAFCAAAPETAKAHRG